MDPSKPDMVGPVESKAARSKAEGAAATRNLGQASRNCSRVDVSDVPILALAPSGPGSCQPDRRLSCPLARCRSEELPSLPIGLIIGCNAAGVSRTGVLACISLDAHRRHTVDNNEQLRIILGGQQNLSAANRGEP